MTKFALSSAAVLCFARLAGATLLFNDSFSYTDGPLVTVSGGAWLHHSGTTTGEVAVASGRITVSSSFTEDVNAPLAGGPYDPAGSTNVFYASFTVRFTTLPNAAGTYFAHFKDTSASGFACRIWAFTGGAGSGKFRLGISSTSGSVISATNLTELSLNSNYTVVTRLVAPTSAARLWINPSSESDPSIATGESPSTFTVAAYAFRQATGEGAMSIDDLRVGTAFVDVVTNAPTLTAPVFTSPPQSQAAVEGGVAVLSAIADANPPAGYQWQFNGTNLPGATGSNLVLSPVSFAQAGFYSVIASNVIDSTTSGQVFLNVFAGLTPVLKVMTYNLHGNGTLNFSTNTTHVQAIGRQVQYLDPDLMLFQEIPVTNNGTAQMAFFVDAFRPGFYLATNSADDGFIHSAILSRYPIVASRSWLHFADLNPFGYTNSNFTRDLFEAEIAVPGFPQHFHAFTVHLKSGASSSDDSAKRAAEAGAVSNFFVAGFLTTNALHPYLLTGDMNEDIYNPSTGSQQPIQRLTAGATGLQLTTPFNPISNGELTFSIQSTGGLTRRYDYILPCGLLYSNAVSSQVFRTDLLTPVPPNLFSNDDVTASDHLPVLMVFGNPYDKPFQLLSIARSNPAVALTWQSVPGQPYRVEGSSNLVNWSALASNVVATGANCTFTTNLTDSLKFFRIHRGP